MGHFVGQGQVKPQPANGQPVKKLRRPVTKTDVRAFLGLVGYYRKCISQFSGIAARLSDLTKQVKSVKIVWDPACQWAFEHLKLALASSPLLHNPNFRKIFYLQIYASGTGIVALLKRVDDEGEEHLVVYHSRKLLPRETSFSAVEECLAIVWVTK